ncbi:hypothetical protein [Flavobacterium aurantiibacter]|nr:hypothetical protein [Flavobacterium aurantiibacter]
MKTIRITMLLILLFGGTVFSQVQVQINVGTPAWIPPTPVAVQYYYLPEINVYYDAPAAQYLYVSRGNWVRTKVLPARYKNYNFARGKVVCVENYRGDRPYVYYKKQHAKRHYAKARGHKKGHGKHKD